MMDKPLAAPEPAGTPPRVTWRLALISIVGFWLLYFFVNSIHMSIERGGMQWGMMARRTFVSLTGMALTFVLCLILRQLEGRSMQRMVTTVFVAAVPVSVAYASVNFAAFYLIYPSDHMADDLDWQSTTIPPSLALIIGTAVSWYFFIVAWGALYVALSYATRVGAAERRAAVFRAAAQTAQLRALRYQINPHFLFNTLNSLSTLILAHRNDDAERMILNLAAFFRTSLTSDPAEDVTLADEIRLQRLYLDIEQSRFGDRLKVVVELPRALEDVPVPGMILQPLVENAIKHGVARSPHPVTIAIRAQARGRSLVLSVEDDAESTTPAMAASFVEGHGLGLRNVRERLAARFETHASCRAAPKLAGGYSVTLTLPLAAAPVAVA